MQIQPLTTNMTNPAPSSRRAARIRQIRERQRAERGGGSGAVGQGSPVSSSSGAKSTADGGSGTGTGAGAGAASKSGNENVGITTTPSMMSEGDASSVASGRSSRLTKGQRAAAYRARKLAKARAASAIASADGSAAAAATTTGTAAASHPPHPPSSIPMPTSSRSMVESPRQSNRPGATSSIQIESAMSSASDVMSTVSSFTTASQMTAKANNSRDRATGTSRPASAPRAGRSPAPSPSGGSENTSSTTKGGSRAASLQKLRAQSPALLHRTSSHGGGSSVSSSRSRSLSVDNKTASPTPPTPIDTAEVERSSGNVSPAPASNIGFETPISPSSPVSTASSKSEHLSVEKGISLIKRLQDQSTTSPSMDRGRTPSPSPRSRNFSSSSPRGSLGPIEERERQHERQEIRTSRDPDAVDAHSREPSSSFSRPDPPRESPTPSLNGKGGGSGSAWDRAHQAVQAQMDAAQEILDGSPSDDKAALRKAIEPEEIREPSVPAPCPSAPVPAPGPPLQQSQEEHDAKVLAEQEVRQLEARATEMKRRMERQAEILGRQEMEMIGNEEQLQYPDSLSQDYLPPHVPPNPQFSNDAQPMHPGPQFSPPPPQNQQQQWEHEPPLQHNDQFSEAGSSIPPPIPSSPYPTYPPTTNNMPFATAPVASSPDHPYGVRGSSSPSMQQRGSRGYVEPPTSSSIHPHSSWQQHQQQSVPPSFQSHAVGQKYPAPPQDQGPYYHHQQPSQLTDVASYQPDAVDPYQAGASTEEKYRQYTLSPPSQGGSTLPGQAQAHGMPAALPYYQDPSLAAAHSQHHQQSFGQHPPMQGSEPVAHMHYESHGETYSYNETNNMSSGVNSNQQQQSRGTIESMAVHPHMQQYSYAGKAGPREASEANASESSYEASSISHLTASTFGTAAPRDPPIASEQTKTDTPTNPLDDFPMERAPFEEERKRPVAPVMSPQEFKSPQTMGFETDSDSMFDDPTFSPQSAENQSVASKAVSDASKSGISWWKDTVGDPQGEGVSNAAEGNNPAPTATSAKHKTHTSGSPHSQSRAHSFAQSLGTVEESSGLDAAGFPIPSPAAKSKATTSSLPPVRSASPLAMNNTVASGQASHLTAGSVASAGSLGMRLAANLNIDADDDEDIFSGIESPTSKERKPKPLDDAASLPNDDIFDGVASLIDSSKMSAAVASASSKMSAAVKSMVSAGTESKASATLNTVEEPKALVDDATSFIGTASLGASKRSSSNLDGSGQNTLNMEYSNSSRENSEKVINRANGDFSSPLNEPPTDGVLGMSTGNNATKLNEASASDVLRMDNTDTSDNQFVMEMSSKDILEFATHDDMGDAGTITSDITSSIIDMGPTAKREAYDAHANAQASKYEPMTSPIAEAEESNSRASVVAHSTATEEGEAEKARESSTFDGSSNYEDEETYDPSATRGTSDSIRGRKSSRRRKHEKKKRRDRGHKSSRRRYDGSDDSYYSDDYDDFTRGGSTVMTSISRDSTTSGRYSQMDLFSRYGCGVLDAIAANCGPLGPPNSFDDRSLDGDETYGTTRSRSKALTRPPSIILRLMEQLLFREERVCLYR